MISNGANRPVELPEVAACDTVRGGVSALEAEAAIPIGPEKEARLAQFEDLLGRIAEAYDRFGIDGLPPNAVLLDSGLTRAFWSGSDRQFDAAFDAYRLAYRRFVAEQRQPRRAGARP